MSKRVQNLERLLQKMQCRYGSGDDLVRQLKQELNAATDPESKSPLRSDDFQRRPGRAETFNASAIGGRQNTLAENARFSD